MTLEDEPKKYTVSVRTRDLQPQASEQRLRYLVLPYLTEGGLCNVATGRFVCVVNYRNMYRNPIVRYLTLLMEYPKVLGNSRQG